MAGARDTVATVGFSGMTPAEASLRGRIGSAVQKSRHDARALTAKARETFLAKFLDEVDPGRKLPEGERLRRAEFARKAHFLRLALKSAQARGRKGKSATRAKKGMPPVGATTDGGGGEAL